MEKKIMRSVHPGEVLMKEFLEPMGITQYRLAKDINVPARRINEIEHGKRAITANTALRLSRYFSTTEQFWMNLQMRYDMELEKDMMGDKLEKEVGVFSRNK
jgi:addiction module HigA family antidote